MSDCFYTPQSGFAYFTALTGMPAATLDVKYSTDKKEAATIHFITITNTGKAVAFFVHVRALKEKGADDILPVIFSDNYISLAPGESRTIECRYENKYAGTGAPYILTSAWNLDAGNSKAEGNAGFEK